MPKVRASSRARQSAPVAHKSAHSFPVALAIALTGAGIVVATLLSWYVFETFRGGMLLTATSTRQMSLVGRVASHLLVNANEQPTIATVQDPDALRATDELFYKDAQVGDRLLVWSDKAVLYSEAMDRVLAVLPIRLLEMNNAVRASSTAENTQISLEQAKIEVRNGTRRVGLAKDVVAKLKETGLFKGILTAGDANTKNYPSTIIVKVTDKVLPETEKNLLGMFGGMIQPLPKTEYGVKGDFLIIVGSDYQK